LNTFQCTKAPTCHVTTHPWSLTVDTERFSDKGEDLPTSVLSTNHQMGDRSAQG